MALKQYVYVSFVQLKMGQSVIYEANMYVMYVLPHRGENMLQHSIDFFFFERERPSCAYQICVIYCVPSIHNIHQDKMQ